MAAPGSAANPLPSRAARPWSLGQALNVVVFGVPFRVVRGVPGAPDSRCCRRTSAATPACRTPPVHSWSSAPRILPRQPASVADAGPGAARRARLRGLVQHAEALHAAPWLVPPAAAGRGGPGIESGTKGAGLAQFRLARLARATVTTTGTRSILSLLNSEAHVRRLVLTPPRQNGRPGVRWGATGHPPRQSRAAVAPSASLDLKTPEPFGGEALQGDERSTQASRRAGPPGPTGSSTSGTRGVVAGLIAAQRLPAIGLQLLAQVGRDDVQLRVDRIEASRARPWEIIAVGRWRSEAAAMRYMGGAATTASAR